VQVMAVEEVVVSADCTSVFCSTQNGVITKWSADQVAWEYDVLTDLRLPNAGNTTLRCTRSLKYTGRLYFSAKTLVLNQT